MAASTARACVRSGCPGHGSLCSGHWSAWAALCWLPGWHSSTAWPACATAAPTMRTQTMAQVFPNGLLTLMSPPVICSLYPCTMHTQQSTLLRAALDVRLWLDIYHNGAELNGHLLQGGASSTTRHAQRAQRSATRASAKSCLSTWTFTKVSHSAPSCRALYTPCPVSVDCTAAP